ncbi:MAG: heme biosynthesis HemY N-terminal domain-containing protein [Rhodospirillales bacterium]|jgi:HemY protein
MLRLLRYLAGVGLLVAGAVWLADRPGAVSMDWLGWQIETSMPVLMVLLLLAGFLLFWLARIFGFLVGMPNVFGRMLAERKQRKGYEALTKGLVAVAAGDPKEALRQARQADSYLGTPPLSLLLAAQAAQLAGDEEGATHHFEAMQKRPETEFLALRGLLTQALKKGERAKALDYARKAYALKPDADWVFAALSDLLIEDKAWEEALDLTAKAAKRHLIGDVAAKRRKALLTLEAAMQASDAKHGAKLAQTAFDLAPDLPAAAIAAARRLKETGVEAKAARLLEKAWKANPHPSLHQAMMGLLEGEEALKQELAVERLVSGAADHPESRIAVARAALKARLWGKARSSLAPLTANAPEARVIALMAAIDEGEGKLSDSVVWLRRLGEATPDPAWVCSSCGHTCEDWSSSCPACHGFDALTWKRPERSLQLLDV